MGHPCSSPTRALHGQRLEPHFSRAASSSQPTPHPLGSRPPTGTCLPHHHLSVPPTPTATTLGLVLQAPGRLGWLPWGLPSRQPLQEALGDIPQELEGIWTEPVLCLTAKQQRELKPLHIRPLCTTSCVWPVKTGHSSIPTRNC